MWVSKYQRKWTAEQDAFILKYRNDYNYRPSNIARSMNIKFGNKPDFPTPFTKNQIMARYWRLTKGGLKPKLLIIDHNLYYHFNLDQIEGRLWREKRNSIMALKRQASAPICLVLSAQDEIRPLQADELWDINNYQAPMSLLKFIDCVKICRENKIFIVKNRNKELGFVEGEINERAVCREDLTVLDHSAS